jgi:Fe-S cluster biogenesis protein NfuA
MNQKETLNKVKEALESIRPFLENDGGNIELVEIKDHKVFVKLQGNCNGCPMSLSTMKFGIENTVKQYVPEIVEVVNVN